MGFGGLIFLLVCAVIALETPAGKKFIVRKVEKSANALLTGRLKIGALRGNLITGMTIEKIGLRDQSGRAVPDVDTTHLAYRIRPFRPFVIINDVDIQGVRQEADGSLVVDGSVSIRDLNRSFDWALPDEEATTIAGFVIHESKSIPEERQAFTFYGKRFIVMKRVKNRITKLRIRPVEPGPAGT